jgi:hypothetical protein
MLYFTCWPNEGRQQDPDRTEHFILKTHFLDVAYEHVQKQLKLTHWKYRDQGLTGLVSEPLQSNPYLNTVSPSSWPVRWLTVLCAASPPAEEIKVSATIHLITGPQ